MNTLSSTSGLIPNFTVLAQPNFVAVDFETANTNSASACQIALVKFSDGAAVDQLVSYIRPPADLNFYQFTQLHGISRSDTDSAPLWEEIAEQVHAFTDGLAVYAHNASFDANVWQKIDSYFGIDTLPKQFFCSYRTAKQLVPGLVNYKLPTVVQALVPKYQLNHHRADSDAMACGLIIAELQRRLNCR